MKTCNLCHSVQSSQFARVESFGYPLVYDQCESCGLVFQSNLDTEADDEDFYAQSYRQIYQANPEPTSKDLYVQENRAATLASLLQTLKIQPPDRILDIGASTGILLETFKTLFYDGVANQQNLYEQDYVVGVEPGDAYRAYAEHRGIKMFASLDQLLASNPQKFGLISMIHVLEHLPDPVGTLNQVRQQLLTDDGILLLEVPNFYAHDSYELAHLVCYTPHTLQQVLRQAGYHVFFFHRHGLPRSSILNLYLTVLAQPLPDDLPPPEIKPDRLVRPLRQLGMLYRKGVEKLLPHQAWLPLPDGNDS